MNEAEFEKLLEESFKSHKLEGFLKEKEAKGPVRKAVGELIKDYPEPQDFIDLHGKTTDAAQYLIKRFISDSKDRGLLTIKIISGKGTGVLLRVTEEVLDLLRKNKRILSFKKEKTGGSFVVYL